jgi:hypothetical protein
MRTISNNILGLPPRQSAHEPAIWWEELPTHRENQFRSSRPSAHFRSDSAEYPPSQPRQKSSALADDDFPFSALIRLVRVMRQ